MPVERTGRILSELKQYSRSGRIDIDSVRYREGSFSYEDRLGFEESSWSCFEKGGRWGGRDKHYWFTAVFKVPESLNGKTIALELTTGREKEWDALNPQFLAYINGSLIQGLDVNHREITLSQKAEVGDVYMIDLHAYSGMNNGYAELRCSVSAIEKEVEKLYYDMKVPYDVAVLLGKEDKRAIDIIGYLNSAVNLIDLRKPYSEGFRKSVTEADEYLEREFYGKYCGHNDVTAYCTGHTHIDVAWLWTVSQTREKAARSFATVLNLMREYPGYVFMSSQPQLYSFIKADHPELFEAVRRHAAEGRWEPEGAMWLEADCNITSGESLVRQILYGTRFFEKEFGVKNRVLWLPDVFGYSAALPQILKKSGIDYFVTSKISWNEYNKMPYDTFMWKGMDGTEILTHFIATQQYHAGDHRTNYNGNLAPDEVMGAWKRYQQKELNDFVLISYGYGDGGGGPTREMLENAKRMERGIPGCPRVRLGKVSDFFKELENRISDQKKLPKWVGELYLEYHRGTYTSMARNKKYNRKSELLYQFAEQLAVMDCSLNGAGEYPREALNKGWETILLNQFHDILPGSSIKEVYEDSKEQYERIISEGRKLVDASAGRIAKNIKLEEPSIVVFNQLGFDRSGLVEIMLPKGYEDAEIELHKAHEEAGATLREGYEEAGATLHERHEDAGLPLPNGYKKAGPPPPNGYEDTEKTDAGGWIVPTQISHDGKLLFLAAGIPSKGYCAYGIRRKAQAQDQDRNKSRNQGRTMFDGTLENGFFKIIFDEYMNIASIFDKRNNREIIKHGQRANVLQAFEDKPHNYDAWDINIYYQEKMWEVNKVDSAELIESGGLRTTVRVKRNFCDSTIVQDISIFGGIPRIDFKTRIDWKETQVLLKAAFPVDIHSDKATYDIQFGNVERPTHWNTSWDQAKFEVCAHKWADLSEDGYGVSLLNDCKYGYDIKEGVMRLTLLKSAKDPNTDADRELHEFTYSLYPHSGDFKAAGTAKMAHELNCPVHAVFEHAHTGTLPVKYSFVKADSENVMIDTVKMAEDSGEIIIRLYEYFNRRSKVRLTFGASIKGVSECDLMENDLSELDYEERQFCFEIRPFEIKTFKVRL